MRNNHITLEEIENLVDLLEPKQVHVNQKTFDLIKPQLDFEPSNLVINNFIPENSAIVIKGNNKVKMIKPSIYF